MDKVRKWKELKFELFQLEQQMKDEKIGLKYKDGDKFKDLVNDYFTYDDNWIFEYNSDYQRLEIKSEESSWRSESIYFKLDTVKMKDENGNDVYVEYVLFSSPSIDIKYNMDKSDINRTKLGILGSQIAESMMNKDSFYEEVFHILKHNDSTIILNDMHQYKEQLSHQANTIRKEYMDEKTNQIINKGKFDFGSENRYSWYYKQNDKAWPFGKVTIKPNPGGKTCNVSWMVNGYDNQKYKIEYRSKMAYVNNLINQYYCHKEDDVFLNKTITSLDEHTN